MNSQCSKTHSLVQLSYDYKMRLVTSKSIFSRWSPPAIWLWNILKKSFFKLQFWNWYHFKGNTVFFHLKAITQNLKNDQHCTFCQRRSHLRKTKNKTLFRVDFEHGPYSASGRCHFAKMALFLPFSFSFNLSWPFMLFCVILLFYKW